MKQSPAECYAAFCVGEGFLCKRRYDAAGTHNSLLPAALHGAEKRGLRYVCIIIMSFAVGSRLICYLKGLHGENRKKYPERFYLL